MHWNDIFENFGYLMNGLLVTLKLSSLSILGSLIFGTLLGVLRHSRFQPFSLIATFFIEFTRSIPLILFIVFTHFFKSC